MPAGLAAAIDAVRRPEYTGENRCTPCTALNVIIAVVLAAGVAVLVPVGPVAAMVTGAAVLAVSAAAIGLRGYLVPGTPRLTRTYFPDWVLRYFDHDEPTPEVDVEPAAVLAAADAVTECEDVDDLCLTDGFRADWYDRMDALRGTDATRAALGAVLDLPAADIDLEEHGGAFVAMAAQPDRGRRRQVGQWESPGAYLADMAAARELEDRVPGWTELSAPARGRVLNGLRVFLDECPSCGGAVAFGEETVESCCRSREVVAVTCEDCGDRLFEAEQPPAG